MMQPSLKEVLHIIISDWKVKQNKNSFECGQQLERELTHFPLDEIDTMSSELQKTQRLLRDVALAFNSECWLPEESPKASVLHAINAYLKTL